MTYLLDTNGCVEHSRGRENRLTQRLANANPVSVVLCSIVVAELHFGAERGKDVQKTRAQVERFCGGYVVVPFDERAARSYGRIRNALARQETPIGPNDLLIAAIAVANDLTIVTHNTDEFGRVVGLRIEDWQVA